MKYDHYINEVTFPGPMDRPIRVGEKRTGRAKRVQEWLCVHNMWSENIQKVSIDDWYGSGTESAIKGFQIAHDLSPTGEVDRTTWEYLVAPLILCMNPECENRIDSLAKHFAHYHPVELKGNKGPWVRSFMKGQDGDWAAWCAGSVSTILDVYLSERGLDIDEVFPWTWSTVKMKEQAENLSEITYISCRDFMADTSVAVPGDLFLVEKNGNHPRHVGIILGVDDEYIHTAEGNTNDEGSREGYEFVIRRRKVNGVISCIKLNM